MFGEIIMELLIDTLLGMGFAIVLGVAYYLIITIFGD